MNEKIKTYLAENKIELEEKYVSETYGTTTLYFICPKDVLDDPKPEDEHATISVEFPTENPEPKNASVMISPTKDGMDYDWWYAPIDYEAIGKLIDIGRKTYNPIQKAYDILVKCNNNESSMLHDFEEAVNDAIRYLGEALA